MAESIPAYPQVEPRSEPASQVINIDRYVNSTSGEPISFFDRALFHTGRSLRKARHTTARAVNQIKRTTMHVAEEYPIHLVVGVAAAAFVAGSGLRIWRSYHE